MTRDTPTVESRYRYYSGAEADRYDRAGSIGAALQLSRDRWNPRWSDPDYLILSQRRRIFSEWLHRVHGSSLDVIDVGGRLQPYRPMFEGRVRHYIAVDPQLEGLADVVAVGEALPFADNRFDVAICAQVLSYAWSPQRLIGEIWRVLKRGGVLVASAPAFFPRHHDERWRVLPDGWRVLLADFSAVEIVPEGYSIAGVCRTINVTLQLLALRRPWLQMTLHRLVIPTINWVGLTLDGFSRGNERFTANYSAFGIK